MHGAPTPKGARIARGALVLSLLAVPACLGGQEGRSPPPDLPGPPPLGLDLYLPVPAENPLTPEKVELGRRLFFDPLLSADRSLRCASCHLPDRAFADTVAVSPGVYNRRGHRNTPSLLNAGYEEAFFWDGRTRSLEEQVVQPIQDPNEMGMALEAAVARLRAEDGYWEAFREAFGRGPTEEGLARALASYVRILRSGSSTVDRYRAGEMDALEGEALEGFRLFVGKGKCANCHLGPTFTDGRFHNTGVAWEDAGPGSEGFDPGRFLVTGDSADLGAFKTPTLRNAALTAPYMHDGSVPTLEEVVAFYDRGGRENPYLDEELRPLRLTEDEKRALVAFLEALKGG